MIELHSSIVILLGASIWFIHEILLFTADLKSLASENLVRAEMYCMVLVWKSGNTNYRTPVPLYNMFSVPNLWKYMFIRWNSALSKFITRYLYFLCSLISISGNMGYELNRFQGDVDEELVCPICSGVLEEPLQVDILHNNNVYCWKQLFWYMFFELIKSSPSTCADFIVIFHGNQILTSF